ncbi:UNVERIFIED_CONTAM: hypothetical protein HDU68_007401 [Siphonaria sp. JEL0065]|nr:hypothetical protein HDU68_007401 [Siphonaria sp. JEL0065]
MTRKQAFRKRRQASNEVPRVLKFLFIVTIGVMAVLIWWLVFLLLDKPATPIPVQEPYRWVPPYYKPTIPSIPSHSQFVKAAMKNNSVTLSWDNPFSTDCPPPLEALIGIFSMNGADATARRTILREKYRRLNAQLPSQKRIDFKFFFGNANTTEHDYDLVLEQTMFPNETVITSRLEDRDSGKILDWFRFARSLMYSPHPTVPNEYCLNYRFVGKADDDAVIHFPRLSKTLNKMSVETKYIGRFHDSPVTHATGMLYLLSADVVEWIYSSPFPAALVHGVEDVQVGFWLQEGKLNTSLVEMGPMFHDLTESPNFSAAATTSESIVVHFCKNRFLMTRCIWTLFDEEDDENEKERHWVELSRLVTLGSLRSRLKHFRLDDRVTEPEFLQTVEAIQNRFDGGGLTVSEVDLLLIRKPMERRMEELTLEFSKQDLESVLYELSLRLYLHESTVDQLLLYSCLRVRMRELGLSFWEWKLRNMVIALQYVFARTRKLSVADVDYQLELPGIVERLRNE